MLADGHTPEVIAFRVAYCIMPEDDATRLATHRMVAQPIATMSSTEAGTIRRLRLGDDSRRFILGIIAGVFGHDCWPSAASAAPRKEPVGHRSCGDIELLADGGDGSYLS